MHAWKKEFGRQWGLKAKRGLDMVVCQAWFFWGWSARGLAAQQLAEADSAAVQRFMPEVRALAEIKLISKGPSWLFMFDWWEKLRLINEIASEIIK